MVRGAKDWGPENLDASGPGEEWGSLVCPAECPWSLLSSTTCPWDPALVQVGGRWTAGRLDLPFTDENTEVPAQIQRWEEEREELGEWRGKTSKGAGLGRGLT